MTIKEALNNAVTFLEALGYTSGDVHDDLKDAIATLSKKEAGREVIQPVYCVECGAAHELDCICDDLNYAQEYEDSHSTRSI